MLGTSILQGSELTGGQGKTVCRVAILQHHVGDV